MFKCILDVVSKNILSQLSQEQRDAQWDLWWKCSTYDWAKHLSAHWDRQNISASALATPQFPRVSAEEKQVGNGMKSAILSWGQLQSFSPSWHYKPPPHALLPSDIPPRKCGRWAASQTAGYGVARTPGNSPHQHAAPSSPRPQSCPRGSAAPRWPPGSPRTAQCPPAPSSTGCGQPTWPGDSHGGHSTSTTCREQNSSWREQNSSKFVIEKTKLIKIHLLGGTVCR